MHCLIDLAHKITPPLRWIPLPTLISALVNRQGFLFWTIRLGIQAMSTEKQSIQSKSAKGGKREGAGRKQGVPNKLSATVKDNVIAVFDQLGGVQHMAEWAAENPSQFYNIYSKLMPLQVNGAGADGEHLSKVVVEFVSADKG